MFLCCLCGWSPFGFGLSGLGYCIRYLLQYQQYWRKLLVAKLFQVTASLRQQASDQHLCRFPLCPCHSSLTSFSLQPLHRFFVSKYFYDFKHVPAAMGLYLPEYLIYFKDHKIRWDKTFQSAVLPLYLSFPEVHRDWCSTRAFRGKIIHDPPGFSVSIQILIPALCQNTIPILSWEWQAMPPSRFHFRSATAAGLSI